jgi:hypothetical protein
MASADNDVFLFCEACTDGPGSLEFHVYEYETMEWREYSLEAHLNFDPQGANATEGTLLPMRNQTHLTLEPTLGLSPQFAMGFMFLNAWEPGQTPQYAGWRVLPHF